MNISDQLLYELKYCNAYQNDLYISGELSWTWNYLENYNNIINTFGELNLC